MSLIPMLYGTSILDINVSFSNLVDYIAVFFIIAAVFAAVRIFLTMMFKEKEAIEISKPPVPEIAESIDNLEIAAAASVAVSQYLSSIAAAAAIHKHRKSSY